MIDFLQRLLHRIGNISAFNGGSYMSYRTNYLFDVIFDWLPVTFDTELITCYM